MDVLRGFGELGLGSRLKRISELTMKETQLVYDYFNIEFDPYYFPVFKIISSKNGVTTSEIKTSLELSQPAITQVINKLSKKQLVLFKNDKLDKRKKIVHLSNKGKKLLIQLTPIWRAIDFTVKTYTSKQSSSLLEHLNNFENNLKTKSFSSSIIENAKKHTINTIEIVNYNKAYSSFFYDLNIEWLQTYFYVETYDKEVLSNPDKHIINKGGHIFFAKEQDTILGTVALMPVENENQIFELTKMAVLPNQRGRKIGQQLMQYCIDFAKQHNYSKLILYSNTLLENAIYIYRKYGFIEIELESDTPYNRSDIKMELKI